jgi:hypothetical protein
MDELRVFPNPVSSKLFIDNLHHQDIQEISLFNSLGRQVGTIREMNAGAYFDMNEQGNGMYFLVIRLEGGQEYIFRVIKI